jgi:MoxR-like ATPase
MSGAEPFSLDPDQRNRLHAVRAAWEEEEGEERLERLRRREEDTETLQLIAQLLAAHDFERTGNLPRAELVRLLALYRSLAPNPNLDARLLARPGEPEEFNRDLRDLLFGTASLSVRIRQFLLRRHAGGQTALQLLCGIFPQDCPLVTQTGLRWLAITPEQRRSAAHTARQRYDLPDQSHSMTGVPESDPVLRLLGEVVIYDAVHTFVEAPDYLAVHRLLTFETEKGRSRSKINRPGREKSSGIRRQPDPMPPFVGSRWLSEAQRIGAPERPAYSPEYAPDLDHLRTADLLTLIEDEIAARGFTYEPLLLRDYYLCLQSKPYVWLLGANGIGKTRLTSLFAEALTGNLATQYRLIPVRPDWGDSSPLLGYVNLLAASGEGRYVVTPFLEFLLHAAAPANAHLAYFLCLDEMNLARVEHYFAEVLSAMESPTRELLLPTGGLLHLPPNLFVTGTLNTDEATHPLSRKVIDRANTISLRNVELKGRTDRRTAVAPTIEPFNRQSLFLGRKITTVQAARNRLREIGETDMAEWIVDRLVEVNGLLEPYELEFAYRVRDEILCYCANSFDIDGGGLLTPDTPQDAKANIMIGLDFQLLQKVLPRLGGIQHQMEPLLTALIHWTESGHFTRTAARLRRLTARLQRDGFVGFD